MSVKKDLHDDEEIIFSTHPSLMKYLPYWILIILGWITITFTLNVVFPRNEIIIFPVTIFLGLLFSSEFEYYRRIQTYYVTNKRLIREQGFISKHITSTQFLQVADIQMHQNLYQRMFKGGNIVIDTMGSAGGVVWDNVPRVRKVKKLIEEEWTKSLEKMYV